MRACAHVSGRPDAGHSEGPSEGAQWGGLSAGDNGGVVPSGAAPGTPGSSSARTAGSSPSAPEGSPPQSGPPGRYQRSAGGMVGAMLVILLVIAAFWVFREAFRTTPHPRVPTVDYAATARAASDSASFDVLTPGSLPPRWRATSATYTPAPGEHWHLGVLTAQDRYLGLEQGAAGVAAMVEEYVDPEATRGGRVRVDGQSWTTYADAGGDHALARREAGVTTLVVGPVDREVLVRYVGSLR